MEGKVSEQLISASVSGGEGHQIGRDVAAKLTALRAVRFQCSPVQDTVLEPESFDVITLLSVAKWIHIHVGDQGMKQVFEKLSTALRPGGVLVLEPQPLKSYRQAFRKQAMPPSVYPWDTLKFLPQHFPKFLETKCGLQRLDKLKVEECSKGFNRPVFIFRRPNVQTEDSLQGGATSH